MTLADLQNKLIELLQPQFEEWKKETGIPVHSFAIKGYNKQGGFLGMFIVQKKEE